MIKIRTTTITIIIIIIIIIIEKVVERSKYCGNGMLL